MSAFQRIRHTTSRRLACGVTLLAGLWLAAAAAATAGDDFLPPQQAYEYAVQADAHALLVTYNIRSGYYLYRKRLGFTTDTAGVTFGDVLFPRGETHHDDYFGDQEIYRGSATFRVPYSTGTRGPAALELTLKLQGCADAGLCYPPQNWVTHVTLPAAAAGSTGSGSSRTPGTLAALLKKQSSADGDFLPVDEAYQGSVESDGPDRIRVRFAIADGYYLYRQKLIVKTDDTRLALGTATLPAGLAHEDDYLGHQEIYRQQVEAIVPVTRTVAGAGTYQVSVSYQGCADAGLCYPPQTRLLSVALPAGGGGSAGSAAPAPAAPAAATPALAGLVALALLGGMLLNLMPCVLPVLSIKAVSLAAAADSDAAGTRAKGFAYTAGVVASMLLLAGALLALRAAGEQIGWGFQLQSPRFVLGLCYLLLLVGLNLSGVFEVGASLAGAGDKLTRGDGARASFFTGVLTTLVATPCTAPFMATAVGIALTQSPAIALTVFAALGIGLAFPYLLVSLVPRLRHLLPKPGVWMNHFKQALAFPMYLSAGWLLWVLTRQASADFLAAAIFGLIFIALAAWCYELRKSVRGHWRHVNAVVACTALGIAIAVPGGIDAAGKSGAAPAASAGAGEWEAFAPARVEALVAGGRPVFVLFTADWCVTCKVNEHVAIENDEVQRLFHAKGVALIKGDWTNQDAVISRELARRGRAGVPLYLWYRPGVTEPEILPQVLTPGLLRERVAALPDPTTPKST
jgi:thiol:disulfide interchange protein DsbD